MKIKEFIVNGLRKNELTKLSIRGLGIESFRRGFSYLKPKSDKKQSNDPTRVNVRSAYDMTGLALAASAGFNIGVSVQTCDKKQKCNILKRG